GRRGGWRGALLPVACRPGRPAAVAAAGGGRRVGGGTGGGGGLVGAPRPSHGAGPERPRAWSPGGRRRRGRRGGRRGTGRGGPGRRLPGQHGLSAVTGAPRHRGGPGGGADRTAGTGGGAA